MLADQDGQGLYRGRMAGQSETITDPKNAGGEHRIQSRPHLRRILVILALCGPLSPNSNPKDGSGRAPEPESATFVGF